MKKDKMYCAIYLEYKINNTKKNEVKCEELFQEFQKKFNDEIKEAEVIFTMLQKRRKK